MFIFSPGNSLIISLNLLAGRVTAPASWISTGIKQVIPISKSVAVRRKLSSCVSIKILDNIGKLLLANS